MWLHEALKAVNVDIEEDAFGKVVRNERGLSVREERADMSDCLGSDGNV